jgi:hypothetical protein
VIQAAESGQVPGATSATAEVGGDPTVVVEVEIVTCRYFGGAPPRTIFRMS